MLARARLLRDLGRVPRGDADPRPTSLPSLDRGVLAALRGGQARVLGPRPEVVHAGLRGAGRSKLRAARERIAG